jgi:RHS repeat-associated protein
VNTQTHNIILTNNGNVYEHGAVQEARVVAECLDPPKSDCFGKVCLCFTKREARLLPTDDCSLITRHLPITDLSQSMQGAGGVGGLLAVTETPTSGAPATCYPLYDGNGNITEYINQSATVVAHYEYDPFGNTIVATEAKANDFNYRFSTKPLDSATGFYYYGFRYYDPITGRWPSRDPIEENGGVNLYGFVGNDGVNLLDIFGNEPYEVSKEGLAKNGQVNCVGFAMSGGTPLEYIAPTDKRRGLKDRSIKGDFESLGWKCEEVKSSEDCKAECNEERALITNTKNDHPDNKDKDQFTYRNINFDGNLTDVHAVYAPSGCKNLWIEVLGNHPVARSSREQRGLNIDVDPDRFIGKKYCCKRKKK